MLNTKIGLNRIDGEVNRGSGFGDGGISVYEASSLSPSKPLLIKARSNSVQHQTIPETSTSNHSSTPFYQYYPQPSSSSFYFQPKSYSEHKQLNHDNNDLDSNPERKKDERKLSFSKESYADKHGIDGDNNDDNQHNGDDKHKPNSSPSTSNDSKNERTAISRCLALEQAYVHDVYSSIARECGACSPVRSHIKEFLYDEFELGSLLMDVGCGDGKYLNLKSDIFTLGLEKCPDWFNKNTQNTIPANALNMSDLMVADVIYLPVRDEFFDGVLCCGVLHHISTTDRRVSAIKEMCRVIKIGGKLLITVWAFEGRELESQDVLIKWNSSKRNRGRYGNTGDQSSDESTSSCSTSSTTTTNYVNRKAAYESCNSPTSQFGTCYSFVRKALQRFSLSSNTFYHSPRRTSKSSTNRDTTSTSGFATLEDMPIELRNIERNQNDPFSSDSPELNHDSSKNKNGSNPNGLSKGVPFLGHRAASLFHLSFSHNNHNQTHSTHGPLSASASVSTSVPGMQMEPTQSTYPHAIDNFGPSTAPVSRQNSITSLIGNNRRVRRDSLFNLIRNSITKPIRKTVGPKNESTDSSPINSASQSPYHKLKNKPSKEKSSTGLNGFLSQHRFSLPVNLRRPSNRRPVQSEAINKSSNNNINEDDNLQENEMRDHLLSSQESTEVSSELLDNLKDSVDQSVNDEILDKSKVLTGCSLDESIVAGVEDNDEDRDGDDEGEDVAEVDDKRSTVEGEGEKEDMLLMIRSSVAASIAGGASKRKRELWGKIMQKSLSSDSLESKYSKQSRQQSTGTETGTITTTTTNTTTTTTTNTTSGTSNSASTSESSSKLVAYYSMPELRLLSWSSCDEEDGLDETGLLRNRINRNKPRLSEIHPITFLNSLGINRRESKGSVIRNDSQDTQNALEDTFDHSILEMATISCTSSGSGGGSGGCGTESHPAASLIPPVYPPPMIPVTLVNKSSFEEASSNSRPPSSSSARSTPLKERLQLNLPTSSARSPSECSSIEGYYYDKSEKDGKTVRSLSVEYKPAICSSYRQGLRRFSASPSLLVSKPFFQLAPHTSGHETHPSVDSEESFVTIIPAGRSCRTGSGTIEASLGDEVDSFMDDVILDIDATSLGSTEDDEALCEQLTRPLGTVDAVGILGRASVQRTSSLGPRSPGIINSSGTNSLANISGVSPCPVVLPTVDVSGLGEGVGVVESDDATSASTATTKSLTSLGSSPKGLDDIDEIVDQSDEVRSNDSASTPSPPANLHRYFHLFKCGELEEVIEQNVENLHVVKSYYSEHATSWCVVAEKVRVWTI